MWQLSDHDREKMQRECSEWYGGSFTNLFDDALCEQWHSGPPESYYTYEQKKLSCQCGHCFERHFDPYEDNKHVGCKYCGCLTFDPDPDSKCQCGHMRHSHHDDDKCNCNTDDFPGKTRCYCERFIRESESQKDIDDRDVDARKGCKITTDYETKCPSCFDKTHNAYVLPRECATDFKLTMSLCEKCARAIATIEFDL